MTVERLWLCLPIALRAVWGPELLAGMLGLVGVLLLQGVLSRLVALPQQRDIDPSQYPVVRMLLRVAMGAIVAGVVEETAFRGWHNRRTSNCSEWQMIDVAMTPVRDAAPSLRVGGT
jgi:hypothetical protein